MTRFTERRPIGGKIAPLSLAEIHLDVPVEDDETPFVITPRPMQVIIRENKPDLVVLENKTRQLVPFMLFIIPKALAVAAQMPVKEGVKVLAHAYGKPLLVKGFGELLDRFLPAPKLSQSK